MTRRWCLLAPAVVIAVTACSKPEPAPAPQPAAPRTEKVSVDVEVTQYRRDQADRMIAVKVTNAGRQPLAVQGVQLESRLFDGPGRVDKDSTVRPGQSVDLRLPYGPPDCSVDAAQDYEVRLWLSSEPISVRASTGSAVLERIHDRECDAQEALAAAPMVWGDEWQRVGEGESLVVDGVLQVGPVSKERVEILELGSTTMFALSSSALPAAVEPGGAAAIPVRFSAQRCDPHAVAESKRGMLFDIRLSLAGREPLLVTVPPGAAGQDALLDALLDRCGLRQPTP